MLLRHYLEQGGSKSALARQLGISRDTLHRWIRAGDLDRDRDTAPVRCGPRAPVPTKLDPYKDVIVTRLTAYPELSAVRLLAEIRGAGYTGGYSQLKAWVRQVRPTPTPEPVVNRSGFFGGFFPREDGAHGTTEQTFPGGTRACRPDGLGPQPRGFVAMGGDAVRCRETRHADGVVAPLGAASGA